MKCQKYQLIRNICIALMLIFLTNSILAQPTVKPSKEKEAPLLFETYQLFLDFGLKSIEKIEYDKIEKPLNGYLDADKTSIVLEDYDGKSRVKVIGRDFNGELHEIKKSSCFIDPYVEL